MYILKNTIGLPGMPLARMLTSILPFLVMATPGMLLAEVVSNTATVTAPAAAFETSPEDNTVVDQDQLLIPFSELSGTVYMDLNGDRSIEPDEPKLAGWVVEVRRVDGTPSQTATTGTRGKHADGSIAGTAVTGPGGNFTISGLDGDTTYTILFRSPETGVVYKEITGVRLAVAATLPDQNLPIDPSGVVYNSVTRGPVAGARVTLIDRSGNPLPEDCYLNRSQANQLTGSAGTYRFDILPGSATACPTGESEYAIRVTPPAGYSFTSTILPPRNGPFDPTGQGAPVRISTSMGAPLEADPVYYIAFRLASGDPDITNNHLPLDPFLTRDGLVVTKTSTRRSANTGDLVPYEITVRNLEAYRRADVDVVDVLPPGMTYVAGTATINGLPAEPEFANGNRELVWHDQVIPPNANVSYSLVLVVGAGITQGQAVNTGLAENGSDGSEISNRGTATVSILPSTVFDCSELIGQVFQDFNSDGYQDDGEPGIPAVRLVTVNGELITTDQHGRYHIACAAVPDPLIGSNFVLKLDENTLPQGWAMTTDNPRSIRLTRGKLSELNFGVAEADLITLEIDARAFARDGSLRPDVVARLRGLAEGEAVLMVIRATYSIGAGDSPALIEARITALNNALEDGFANGWTGPDPFIQVDAASASPTGNGE